MVKNTFKYLFHRFPSRLLKIVYLTFIRDQLEGSKKKESAVATELAALKAEYEKRKSAQEKTLQKVDFTLYSRRVTFFVLISVFLYHIVIFFKFTVILFFNVPNSVSCR